MLTVKTSRHVKSFRSCRHATGRSLDHLDAQRIAREAERLAAREAWQLWLEEQWNHHFEGAAGPLRTLPPSARARQTQVR